MKAAILMALFAVALAVGIAAGVKETLDFANHINVVFKAKLAEAGE